MQKVDCGGEGAAKCAQIANAATGMISVVEVQTWKLLNSGSDAQVESSTKKPWELKQRRGVNMVVDCFGPSEEQCSMRSIRNRPVRRRASPLNLHPPRSSGFSCHEARGKWQGDGRQAGHSPMVINHWG